MENRNQFQQLKLLKNRLVKEAKALRDEAKLLPEGSLRDAALRKAVHTDTAVLWINSVPVRHSN
jgi:hypothetical protein